MKYSIVFALSIFSFAQPSFAHAPAKLVYMAPVGNAKVAKLVTLKNWGTDVSDDNTMITIKDPYLEASDEDYPLIFDDETLNEVCKLSGAGAVQSSEPAGSLNLTAGDFATFAADGTLLSDAEKHGIDPAGRPGAVISTVTCLKN